MARTGIIARILNVLRRVPGAFREGYRKDTGVRLPDSLARRQKPPPEKPPKPS